MVASIARSGHGGGRQNVWQLGFRGTESACQCSFRYRQAWMKPRRFSTSFRQFPPSRHKARLRRRRSLAVRRWLVFMCCSLLSTPGGYALRFLPVLRLYSFLIPRRRWPDKPQLAAHIPRTCLTRLATRNYGETVRPPLFVRPLVPLPCAEIADTPPFLTVSPGGVIVTSCLVNTSPCERERGCSPST